MYAQVHTRTRARIHIHAHTREHSWGLTRNKQPREEGKTPTKTLESDELWMLARSGPNHSTASEPLFIVDRTGSGSLRCL